MSMCFTASDPARAVQVVERLAHVTAAASGCPTGLAGAGLGGGGVGGHAQPSSDTVDGTHTQPTTETLDASRKLAWPESPSALTTASTTASAKTSAAGDGAATRTAIVARRRSLGRTMRDTPLLPFWEDGMSAAV